VVIIKECIPRDDWPSKEVADFFINFIGGIVNDAELNDQIIVNHLKSYFKDAPISSKVNKYIHIIKIENDQIPVHENLSELLDQLYEADRDIITMLALLQSDMPYDRTERRMTFSDYWHQRNDPQVQLLQEKLVRADTKIAKKDLQIQQLNVALKQAEDAGKKERIRTDTQRGNLVKRTKNQWFLDNNITNKLSEQEAQYEQGV
jgi:hypothetical protein